MVYFAIIPTACVGLVGGSGRALSALVLALLASATTVADATVAERVLTAYSALNSYCDTVTMQDSQLVLEKRRCYTRDGRYKHSEQLERPIRQRHVQWGDTVYAHRWHTDDGGNTIHYSEEPTRDWHAGGLPEGLTTRALSAFLRGTGTEAQARNILHSMEVVENGVETTVLQRSHKSPVGTDVVNRIWVRHADGLVVRAEETWNGGVAWSASLVEARANPSLSQADLAETAPFFQRYGWKTRPRAFASGLAVTAFVMGLVVSIAWRRTRNWPRIWLVYAKGVGTTVVSLAVLALLSLSGSGHPPAIILTMILGVFAALAALTLAALMLGMQLGDRGKQLGSDHRFR